MQRDQGACPRSRLGKHACVGGRARERKEGRMKRSVLRVSQVAVLAALFVFALASGNARAVSGGVMPNQLSLVDCNGWSPAHQSLAPAMRSLCADPINVSEDGDAYPATDNGHYIGHD